MSRRRRIWNDRDEHSIPVVVGLGFRLGWDDGGVGMGPGHLVRRLDQREVEDHVGHVREAFNQ